MSWETKNFKASEFDTQGLPGTGAKMQAEFINRLQKMRDVYGKPMKITSGYRTELHNAKVKGATNSPHLRGWAADIAATTGRERMQLIQAAIEVGFNRIGVAKTFIHVDCDPSLDFDVMWLY